MYFETGGKKKLTFMSNCFEMNFIMKQIKQQKLNNINYNE